ncbi:hypothetical protein [Mesorhizobium sp. M0571]|uniref:hypothetical protein n=1 Tax=Mesorhizobium sp. M0571 TaxID=2956960 RepID=UPI003334E02A
MIEIRPIGLRRKQREPKVSAHAPPVAVAKSQDTRRRLLDGLALYESILSTKDLEKLDGLKPTVSGFKTLTHTGSDALRGPNSDLRPRLQEELKRLALLQEKKELLKKAGTSDNAEGERKRAKARLAKDLVKKVEELQALLALRDADNMSLLKQLEDARANEVAVRKKLAAQRLDHS